MPSRFLQVGRIRDGHPLPTASRKHADQRYRHSATASILVDSGQERIVHVYPDAHRTSSGGSASVRSPASSGDSRSLSSEESWSDVGYDDGIDPSDSASRSRHPRSRRHTVEVRDAPPRRRSSRRIPDEREESPPRRHASHRHHSSRRESRHERSHSRRVPSDESSGSVASPDDYPYGHHGMPRAPYPPQSGYRHVPAQSHGGSAYPPSMPSGAYHDPYNPQALVHMHRPDPFGHPQQSNPFAPQSQHPNPFSPMSQADGSGYFAPDAMGPPPLPHQRPGPQRPQSYAAPNSYYGTEIMPAYPPGYPSHGYPPPPSHYGWAASHASSPPPRDEEALKTLGEIEKLKQMMADQAAAAEKAKPKPLDPELEASKELLKRLQEDLLAQQKALAAERLAEATAKAAAKVKEEEDKKRKEEISAATKKAKDDAEKKADEAAKKAKEEHEKKLAEAVVAKEEADKAKKALEEQIKKNAPTPDSLKAPIRFKDAVGRKFSFPWHLCKTWKGMEGLIKQAFSHIEDIGDHVYKGHYDLTGPDGDVILPQVWDTMVQPDWEINMHMWPLSEEEKRRKEDKLAFDAGIGDPFAALGLHDLGMMPPPGDGKKKGKEKSGKGKGKDLGHDMVMVPPGGAGAYGGDPFANLGMLPHGVTAVLPDEKKLVKSGRPKANSTKSAKVSGFSSWMLGGAPVKKKK